MNDITKHLLSLISKDHALMEAAGKIRPGVHLNIRGLCEEQKGFVICALANKLGKKPVIIVPDALRAREMADSVKPYVDGEVVILPPSMLTLVSAFAGSRDDEIERIAALSRIASGNYGAVILPGETLINKIPLSSDIQKRCIEFELGSVEGPSNLSNRLSEAGYERVSSVSVKGEFSWRGDIVDVFPPDMEQPVRISFFDDEVDQIKIFDPDTQRSSDSIKTVTICPATEFFIAEDEREYAAEQIMNQAETEISRMSGKGEAVKVARLLRENARKDSEAIKQGMRVTGFAKWISCAVKYTCSILDYPFTDSVLFLSELSETDKRMGMYQAEYALRCQNSSEVGMAPFSARNSVFEKSNIMRRLDRGEAIAVSCFGSGFAGGIACSLTGFPQESYNRRIDELADLIKLDNDNKERRLFFFIGESTRAEDLRKELAERSCYPELLMPSIRTGFTYPALGISVFGEQDLFGQGRITKPKKKNSARLTFIGEIKVGDYVVHDDYGIGRYEGIESRKVDKETRDFLKIVYAKDQIVYLVPERMDLLQKYIGPGDKEPKLSKLGGSDWTNKVEKAQRSIKKTAYDLLSLYAVRDATEGFEHFPDSEEQKAFEEAFPFVETEDQIRAINEIKHDMESKRPMDRLLCGDVGFGKTEVAMRAMIKCVMSGKQAVMIAPTTLLAQQHYETMIRRCGSLPVSIVLLSRFVPAAKLKTNISMIKSGKADIIIGTHRALSEDIVFKDLGLLVIDEEQRFGVNHKEKIKNIRKNIDVLSLSATPIPRTLHMSLSGIRDISMIEEAPINRRAVQTYVMEYDDDIVIQACLREIGRGGQVFYLHNAIRNIDTVTQRLAEKMPGVRVIYAHGKMNEQELEQIIMDFAAGKYDILVCTTIIENGVDMPNVNTLIVEDADRFGLAQLYQIKGRVGRSDRQAYAYITYDPDKILKEDAAKRLEAIREFTELGSGVKIAMRDLEVRGAGSLLGAEQHGMMEAIGYELYCRMLDEEIFRLKKEGGEEIAERAPEVPVSIDFECHIPSGYIVNESDRMIIYRKISDVADKEEYDDLLDEVTDRFGDPPRQVGMLAGISVIRHMAALLGFRKVDIKNTGVRMIFDPSKPIDMKSISTLMSDPKMSERVRIDAVRETELVYKPVSVQNELTIEEVIRILCILSENKSVV
ncbi:MAG: transcription-repair coupling factor [Saccharofermentans sp.]|nr:transcription-repair coupling factor [Saccharofermentans sp.]